MKPRRADHVMVKTAFGRMIEKVAVSGVERGDAFLVVYVCSLEEWDSAAIDGREPHGTPWPSEDVRVLSRHQ